MLERWIDAHGESAQMLLFVALFALFGVAEALAPRRPAPAKRRRRWPTNLLLTALNVAFLSLLPVSFLGVAMWARERGVGLLNLVELPLALLVAANLLGRGFISFATHWLMHRVPLFWRVHRVHHIDTELDVSTTVRFHPLEFLIGLLPGAPLVALLGLAPWLLVLYELLDAAINVFSHSNVRVPRRLDRALRYLVVTPDLHRVHHSSHQPETDSNFGAVFPVWDLVFGTFRTETREPAESMRLGLDEVRDERAHRLRWLLASPLLRIDRAPPRAEGEDPTGGRAPGARASG